MRHSNFSGNPTLIRIMNKPSLLTRSNAFLRSMEEIYKFLLFSMHFSCIRETEKNIMSIIDLPELNPHCDSDCTHTTSCCSRTSTTCKDLTHNDYEVNTLVVLAVSLFSFIFVGSYHFGITHVLRAFRCLKTLAENFMQL